MAAQRRRLRSAGAGAGAGAGADAAREQAAQHAAEGCCIQMRQQQQSLAADAGLVEQAREEGHR